MENYLFKNIREQTRTHSRIGQIYIDYLNHDMKCASLCIYEIIELVVREI